jgi:hypothetical protein
MHTLNFGQVWFQICGLTVFELKFDSQLHYAGGRQILLLHDAARSQVLPLQNATGSQIFLLYHAVWSQVYDFYNNFPAVLCGW